MSRPVHGTVRCDQCGVEAPVIDLLPFSVEPGSMDVSDIDLPDTFDGDEWRSVYDDFGTRFDYCSADCEEGVLIVVRPPVDDLVTDVVSAARTFVFYHGTDDATPPFVTLRAALDALAAAEKERDA